MAQNATLTWPRNAEPLESVRHTGLECDPSSSVGTSGNTSALSTIAGLRDSAPREGVWNNGSEREQAICLSPAPVPGYNAVNCRTFGNLKQSALLLVVFQL